MLLRLTAIAPVAAATSTCSKTETAQARGGDDAPKPVSVEQVKQDTIHRAVEVVGTLRASTRRRWGSASAAPAEPSSPSRSSAGSRSVCSSKLLLVPVAYVQFDALEQAINQLLAGMDRPREGVIPPAIGEGGLTCRLEPPRAAQSPCDGGFERRLDGHARGEAA